MSVGIGLLITIPEANKQIRYYKHVIVTYCNTFGADVHICLIDYFGNKITLNLANTIDIIEYAIRLRQLDFDTVKSYKIHRKYVVRV